MSKFAALAVAITMAALSGCAAMHRLPEPLTVSPQTPTKRETAYSRPLQCLGELYATYSSRQEPLIVAVMPAVDNTQAFQFTNAEIPREFTLMVESAVNSVSPRIRLSNVSHEFLVNETALGVQLHRMLPNVLLKPGISEFDRGLAIRAKRFDVGAFFGKGRGETDASFDRGNDSATTRVALDMVAYDYATMTSLPNAHASLGVEVGRNSVEQGWSIAIYGWGIGSTVTSKAIQARHEAVRVLTEYAVLQTLGRYLSLPYWRCAEGVPEDEAIKSSLQRLFKQWTEKEQIAQLQELLQYHGFSAVKPTGTPDAATTDAMLDLQSRNPRLPTDLRSVELYYRLYASIPVPGVQHLAGWNAGAPP